MANAEKTEKASPKRLKDAREKGEFASTRHFLAGSQFLAFVFIVHAFGNQWLFHLQLVSRTIFEKAFARELSPNDWLNLFSFAVMHCIVPPVVAGAGLLVVALALQLSLTGMGFSVNKLAPDFKHFNPITKLKQIPKQNGPALLQAVILIPVCGYAIYALAANNLGPLIMLPLGGIEAGRNQVMGSFGNLLWRGAGLFFLFGCVDLFREKRKHLNQLRMTKEEVKEEHKQLEGDPQIKARIRQIRRTQARKNMMQQIPTATAVIVNPTHYAVAIRYDPEIAAAPMVVAKGKNYLALRIRQRALEHNVPLVENKPLAQGLYKAVDVGHEIPPHLYRAVAEILAYIFRLMQSR